VCNMDRDLGSEIERFILKFRLNFVVYIVRDKIFLT